MLSRAALGIVFVLTGTFSAYSQTNIPPSVALTSPADGSTFSVPVDTLTLTASASDSDGTISKVEFFQGSVKLGTSTTSPYQFAWNNVPAGTYVLTAKATDNSGAITTSSPANVTVNPMTLPVATDCPAASSKGFGQIFHLPGDGRIFLLEPFVAPCELIEVRATAVNYRVDVNTLVTLTYYNYKGENIFSQTFGPEGSWLYPSSFSDQSPWRGVRDPNQWLAYLKVVATGPLRSTTEYPAWQFDINRSPRQGYNLGGDQFSNAPTITSFPTSFFGSLRPYEANGQIYKVTLQPSQQLHISAQLRGRPNNAAFVYADLYDANQQKVGPPTQYTHWASTSVSPGGFNTMTSGVLTNPSSTNQADYFVNIKCQYHNVWDFRLDFIADSCPVQPGSSSPAPDATGNGSLATAVSEYKLPAVVDPDVLAADTDFLPGDPSLTGRETELWASIYRPASLTAGPYPLIVMLHGNHGTCGDPTQIPRWDIYYPVPDANYPDPNVPSPQIKYSQYYTFSGACPPDQNNPAGTAVCGTPAAIGSLHCVVPSHRGYDYLGQQLASRGFIVVSINADRGINAAPGQTGDAQLIMARGRLVLKHLQKLSEWNQNGGTPASLGVELQGKIDFGNVGLVGHSRGGEGVRAAYNIYTGDDTEGQAWRTQKILSTVTIKAIFEIGPTDAMQVLNTSGVKWNVLLPMCDRDVFTLEGVRVLDRMLLAPGSPAVDHTSDQKSSYTVWGANHNYYNAEWQQYDNAQLDTPSNFCIGLNNLPLFSTLPNTTASSTQQQTGLASVLAFFRANLGTSADSNFNKNFNPLNSLPNVVNTITRVDRGFAISTLKTIPPANGNNLVFQDYTDGTPPVDLCATPGSCSATSGILRTPAEHHPNLQFAEITWSSAGPNTILNIGSASSSSVDVSAFQYLDFRVTRAPLSESNIDSVQTNFSVQLVDSDGLTSAMVPLCNYIDLRGPVGGYGVAGGSLYQDWRPILQTVHIPLSALTGASLNRITSVRLVFNKTMSGDIYVTNIRFSK